MQVMQSVVNDLFGDSSSLLKTLTYQISQHCFPRFEATLPDHIVLKASGLIEVNQDNVVQSIDEKLCTVLFPKVLLFSGSIFTIKDSSISLNQFFLL